ncbi:MAG: family 78 glycoside hydrolase catalytic domain [Actinobacteria bacterium]|nr:family 78 glycoside hydrolase catalytic domain [Actinomycetota bacterium]
MKFTVIILTILLLATFSSTLKADANLIATNLRCEYLKNPLGIDVKQPRLSWVLDSGGQNQEQTAYRILVADSREKLEKNSGNLWDSGKVQSNQSVHIVYSGQKLKSRQQVFWKVRVWDKDGRPSAWSKTAVWEMALNLSDWQAKWTGISQTDNPEISKRNPALYFRKSFQLAKGAKKARVYISGLGYYELYINGKKVGDHVLSPNYTNYDRRQSDHWGESRVGNMSTRVLYETFDIAPFLRSGENVVAVCLGNGWYFQNEREEDIPYSYDTPRFIAQLEMQFSDRSRKTVVSDNTWKTSHGPIVQNGIYSGEIYDARLEQPGWNNVGFDDSHWKSAHIVRPPTGKLMAQMSPPDRVIETIEPVSLSNPEPGIWRYDLGQVISGWARLKVTGPRGAKIKLKFIEQFGFSYGQTDTYILKGEGEEVWEPSFTWHAFRYVDVLDAPFPMTIENLQGRVVNTNVDSAGNFSCSNHIFNKVLENYKWTQLGNIHGGVPSDCPHRERRGYTGDGQISAQAAIYNFDMAAFYTKWLNDIADAQNSVTGYVPNTVPYQGGGGGAAWGSAYIIIPWYMALYYGDERVLEQHYRGMKKWIAYLARQRDDDGIINEKNLGEWVPPDPTEIPASFVSTAYFYHDLKLMSKIAKRLHQETDSAYFDSLAQYTRTAFHEKYYHAEKHSCSIGRQGANVFALGFGLVPDSLQSAVFATLVHNVQVNAKGHFDTGMMGTPLLLDVLSRFGRTDLAYTLMDQRDYPSFGYELEKGATTIWETWWGTDSHSHPMFGSVCQWFYQVLAGINPDSDQPGFQHIIIKPQPVAGLNFVDASYHSIRGYINSRWEMKNGDFILHVSIPANTTASVFLPAVNRESIMVGGRSASFVAIKKQVAEYCIGSGEYSFTSKNVEGLLRIPMLTAPIISPADTLVFLSDTVTVRISSDMDGTEIRFTLDGSEPSERSALYEKPLRICKSSVIKARVFKKGVEPGFTKTRRITFIDPKKNGLHYDYFRGQWNQLPDFRSLKPLKSGRVYEIGLQHIIANDNAFALVFSGMIEIPQTGDYTFSLKSNDGSQLFINGRLVVDNDMQHGSLEKSGSIRLTSGRHPIKITYFQAGGGLDLQAFISGPGLEKQKIPAGMLFQP